MPAKLLSASVLIPLLLGCGSSETQLSGTVTVNGRPLQQGYITFFPTEGTTSVRGTKVIDGRYQMEQMGPGKHRVVVSGTPDAQVSNSGSGPATLKFAPSPNWVSSKATGNQQVVEILTGKQSLDFALQNPPNSSR